MFNLALPARVRGYPTPWLSAQQIHEYLPPLNRESWRVTNMLGLSGLCLATRYAFSDSPTARSFINQVYDIGAKEKHDACIVHLPGNRHLVDLCLETHTASPSPTWSEIGLMDLTYPGVTMRDVRMAILVEQMFRDKYPTGEKPTYLPPIDRPPDRLLEAVLRVRDRVLAKANS